MLRPLPDGLGRKQVASTSLLDQERECWAQRGLDTPVVGAVNYDGDGPEPKEFSLPPLDCTLSIMCGLLLEEERGNLPSTADSFSICVSQPQSPTYCIM